jgi:hypothetical protein
MRLFGDWQDSLLVLNRKPTSSGYQPETVLNEGEGAQFNYGPTPAYQCVLKLNPLR